VSLKLMAGTYLFICNDIDSANHHHQELQEHVDHQQLDSLTGLTSPDQGSTPSISTDEAFLILLNSSHFLHLTTQA